MSSQILVPLHTFPDGNAENIAVHAAAVAAFLKADVNAAILDADFPPVSSPLGNLLIDVTSLVSETKARCLERGSALARAMEREMARRAIPLRTTRLACRPEFAGDLVTDMARYHDIVVIGLGSSGPASRTTAEAVLFGSGRPVILVPEDGPVASFGHVMIAWDGSRVAARAVSDARDVLQRAERITIVSVRDEKALPDPDPGGRLADYLGHHGIHAATSGIRTGDRPIADTLQSHALEIGAGMIVMGGYGHSRMREFVLGGATGGVLNDLRIPVLLAH